MNIIINISIFLFFILGLTYYFKSDSKTSIGVLAALFTILIMYNSIRFLAPYPVNMSYISHVFESSQELNGLQFARGEFSYFKSPPRLLAETRGDYNKVINIFPAHPWHYFTSFHVFMQWHIKDKNVVAVLYVTDAQYSYIFSGMTFGPDYLGGGWIISTENLGI